jgi:hypothetical protein
MSESEFQRPSQAKSRATIAALLVAIAATAQTPGPEILAAAMKPNNDPNVMQALAAFAQGQPLSCPYCQMQGIFLIGKKLTKANLMGADLTGADLRRAVLDGAILAGANLTNTKLDNAQLTSAANGPANLSRANLTGATLRGTQLAGVNLQFAKTAGADFTGTDLSRTVVGPKRGKRNVAANQAWACGNADLSHLSSRVYVSPQGSDNGSCGTSTGSACQTIAQGIQRCSGSGCGVLVAWGEYSQNAAIPLRNGVNVYGGCLPASQSSPSYVSSIQAPAGGLPPMSANQISSATVLQGFQLSGSAAGGTTGAPSIALQVTNSSGLQIMDTEILAGTGGQGGTGGNGGTGTEGGKATGANPGYNGACSNTQGGWGAGQNSPDGPSSGCSDIGCPGSCGNPGCAGYWGQTGTTGIEAQGGGPGSGVCESCPTHWAGTGNPGNPGTDAGCGGAATASTDITGSFSGGVWKGSVGGTGGNGGVGGGGAGGGAGGFYAGNCFWVLTQSVGGAGGGGGAGGCGGGGGLGGQQGGASFAVIAVASTLNFTRSRIVAGMSGLGGAGGPAGTGGAGGASAAGSSGGANGTWGGPGRAGRVEKAGPAVAAPGAPVETADHLLVSRWSGMLRLRVRGLPIIWGMRAHRDRVVQALHRVQAVAREQQADAGIKGWWLIRVSIRGG